MKPRFTRYLAAAGLLSTLNLQPGRLMAQGTAFTYQGQLSDSGQPANGSYDLRFAIYDAGGGGNLLAGPLTNSATGITNGLFTVTLDFGSGVFTGPARWLEIGARTNGAGAFATLSPRQDLLPSPYAIMANSASNLVGTLPAAQLSGTIPSSQMAGTYSGQLTFNNPLNSFCGNGSCLAGVNANLLGGLPAANFWQLSGNAGTTPGVNYLGTKDNQPLELHVNGVRALRLEPQANGGNNVIGGFSGNYVASGVSWATIAGGGLPNATNRATGSGGTIGGGANNWVSDWNTTISGGANNSAIVNASCIGGGSENYANGDHVVIGGGQNNSVNDAYSTVGGGGGNAIAGGSWDATIAGGNGNAIQAGSHDSTIGGGYLNTIQSSSDTGTIAGGYQNIIVTNSHNSSISGGAFNVADGDNTAIGGGYLNAITGVSSNSAIAGGLNNAVQTYNSFVGGGSLNTIQSGAFNSTIAGGLQNLIQYGSEVDSGAYCFIGAGLQNTIQHDAEASMIGSGLNNTIQFGCQVSTIGGGDGNSINTGPGPFDYSAFATIGGGNGNGITGSYWAGIGGGYNNTIMDTSPYSVIAGGGYNSTGTNAQNATIAGGYGNSIQNNAQNAAIGGGIGNSCLGNIATVPGGYYNVAGFSSFAAGTQARAVNSSAFVWADNQGTPFSSTANNQVSFRCLGGVRFTSGSTAFDQTVSWTPGSGSWAFSSDKNLKDRFAPVDTESVLARVGRLQLSEWSYKGYDQRHIGPMAQDFHALFPLNESDKTLNDTDLHGVELAAIQALNKRLEREDLALKNQVAEQAAQLKDRDAAIQSLAERLHRLEEMLSH